MAIAGADSIQAQLDAFDQRMTKHVTDLSMAQVTLSAKTLNA